MSDYDYYAFSVYDVAQRLETTVEGLGSEEARCRLKQYGPNVVVQPGPPRALWLFLGQFTSPLVLILIVASAVAYLIGEHTDASVIAVIVLFNATIGFWQERRAGSAMERLRSLAEPEAQVMRDRHERRLPIRDLVPGDVIILEPGLTVPADGRLVEAVNLKANEAIFSGESVPVEKYSNPLPAQTPLTDRANCLWRGTSVVYGRGRLLITATGMVTRFGEIIEEVSQGRKDPTPFQQHLSRFARRLTIFIFCLGVVVFILGLSRNLHLSQVFLLSVSLIVSLIPEGLPVVMTVTLGIGMWHLARRKALIRKLAAVETLGSVTTIAADKTGTLTYSEMMVEDALVGGVHYTVSGRGYSREGDFFLNGKPIDPLEIPDLALALKIGMLCNDSRFGQDEQGREIPIGDPTEVALVVAAEKAGFDHQKTDETIPRVGEFPFDFHLRYMVTFHTEAEGKQFIAVKGAPRQLLDLCDQQLVNGRTIPFTSQHKQALRQSFEQLAQRSLRGIAIAFAETKDDWRALTAQHLKSRLVFVGLFGLRDTIRAEAKETITRARAAGIRVMMLTGDYRVTAEAIAQDLGLLEGRASQAVIDGKEISQLTDEQLAEKLVDLRVASRLSPEDKYRIARLLKARGEVVAMTGDGVNDVPALREANIGVAIGSSATDAAKETAEMIVTDGNLSSIVAAIEAGRVIYRNIQRVLLFLLASNFAELFLILTALLGGLPLPLLPTQIIWLNVLTDPFVGLALAQEPGKSTILTERPRPAQQPIIAGRQWTRLVVVALAIALGSFIAFLIDHGRGASPTHVFALTLTTIAIGEWLSAFSFRSARISMFKRLTANRSLLVAFGFVVSLQVLVLSVPRLASALHITALSLSDWGMALLLAMPVIIVEELWKVGIRQRQGARI